MISFVAGNLATLLRNGAEYFPALEAAIDGALRTVYLETYIFEDDTTGRRIAAALARAARRGVRTHLLLDGFGSRKLPKQVVDALLEAGAMVLWYRPATPPFRLSRRSLRRLHRKLAVIDGRLAFVGGINIVDDTLTSDPRMPPRFDYAVAIEGPLATDIQAAVRRLWLQVAWVHLKRRWQDHHPAPPRPEPRGDQHAAFLIRNNFRHRRDIQEAYLEAIASARSEIVIANAYFFPGRSFRHALIDAARRGVRVVLLLQGRVEYALLHYGSRALYGSLLDAGIEIHEYHRSFLHAKVAVIDRRWATVGSSNIDPFSLLLAQEANVVLLDRKFAGELRNSLEQALAEGTARIMQARWKQQPLGIRILSWLCYGLMRLFTGISYRPDRTDPH